MGKIMNAKEACILIKEHNRATAESEITHIVNAIIRYASQGTYIFKPEYEDLHYTWEKVKRNKAELIARGFKVEEIPVIKGLIFKRTEIHYKVSACCGEEE